jgi:DNA helicase-2/ATP-dependent DNA helicase PcrA
LTRTNAQCVLVAESLRAAGAPVRVRGQTPFLQLAEVREAVRALHKTRGGLRSGLDELAQRVDSSEEESDEDSEDGGQLRADLSDAELARLRNLEELLRLGFEYADADSSPTAAGFESWLAATVGTDEVANTGNAVDVATFHAAKGLEWPTVHLAGLERGLVPIGHAQSNDSLEEERRLFYVAVTRAERELHLHWAGQRTFGTKTVRRDPSPYLDELEPLFEGLRMGAAPADRAALLRVPGIGPVKLERFGSEVLAVVHEHAAAH